MLVANQTRIVEAVADPEGCWLPGVPVSTVTPHRTRDGASGAASVVSDGAVWELAAVLTAPIASVFAWHAGGGTGLSTRSVRIGPAVLAAIPWPAGDLATAVQALQAGDIQACGRAVTKAYAIGNATGDELLSWWAAQLPRGA